MSTSTKPRPRVKPARRVRWFIRPTPAKPIGSLEITVGKETAGYWCRFLPSDFGIAVELQKWDDDAEAYHVNLNADRSTCECKGFLRWATRGLTPARSASNHGPGIHWRCRGRFIFAAWARAPLRPILRSRAVPMRAVGAIMPLASEGLFIRRIVHNLTACFLWRSKLPFSFPTDRECIAEGVRTCWQPRPEAVRMAVVPNTLELAELWGSSALIEESRGRRDLEVAGEARALPFDAAGNLRQEELFPHSVRGRRGSC